MSIKKINKLSPTQFENLTYDLVRAAGFRNLTWRTPGSDSGRDIEAEFHIKDASGTDSTQKWYVECKKYAKSVSWPVVFEKVSFAKNHRADYLLMVSNNNPSPACENEINIWNSSNNLQIRFWRGYDLERLISQHNSIAVKYGIYLKREQLLLSIFPLSLLSVKLANAAAAAAEFSRPLGSSLIAASAVGELLLSKLSQIEELGRPYIVLSDAKSAVDDCFFNENATDFLIDGSVFRAIVELYRYFTQSEGMSIALDGDILLLTPRAPRLPLARSGEEDLQKVAQWGDIELIFGNNLGLRRAKP